MYAHNEEAKRSWRFHALLIITIVTFTFSIEHWLHGWSTAILVGAAVPAVAVYATSKAWGETWYWITMVTLAALQIPLMLCVQPLIVRWKFSFVYLLAFVDYFVVVIIAQCLALVFSKAYAKKQGY